MQEEWADRDIIGLCEQAARLRDLGKGKTVTYSLNAFLPLTRLCRNACSYCNYRLSDPGSNGLFLSPDRLLATAKAGQAAGCTEALLVSGDKPELRYPGARRWLRDQHFESTAHYACEMARLLLRETRLYPHTNVGVASRAELASLKQVNASIGLMLETTAERLCRPGEPHGQSPDKLPKARLDFLTNAGELHIPTTTGLLIGIGETRQERVDALIAIRNLHERYGHIQEVIVQHFTLGQGSTMVEAAGAPFSEILWTCAVARLLLGPCMNLQVAPNLVPQDLWPALLAAGINDWGGISTVTQDYVNPDSPWPAPALVRTVTETAGFHPRMRFPVYPEFADLLPLPLKERLRRDADEEGYVRTAGE